MEPGDFIRFGNYDWQVLEVRSQQVLIITKFIIGSRWYHDSFTTVTWAECTLRKFLNTRFYHSFSPEEQTRIMEVQNRNADNPWFGTQGGEDTRDFVFLLSLDEVCRYFGDSSPKLYAKGGQRWQIDDEYNPQRIALLGDKPCWWRLRSPGYYSKTAASVSAEGKVYVRGNGVSGTPKMGGGLRPALWLRV